MPMIDVYAPSDLLPSGSDRRIGEELTRAVLRAEGVRAPGPFHLENTAAFIHRMEPATVQTAADAVARVIRVQIITTRRKPSARGCCSPKRPKVAGASPALRTAARNLPLWRPRPQRSEGVATTCRVCSPNGAPG